MTLSLTPYSACLFFSLGHSLLFTSLSSICSFSINLITEGCDERLKWGEREIERERRVGICSPRQSACVLGWADGGSGWHSGGTGTSAGRHEHRLSPPIPESLLLTLSLSPLTQHIHNAALISTTCPQLSACRGGSNMGSSVWQSSTGVDEVHNQGNVHIISQLWADALMWTSDAESIKITLKK